jgi:integrase
MANISTSPTGERTIQFLDKHRKRRTIRLGKVPLSMADRFLAKVNVLNAAAHMVKAGGADPSSWDSETARWVANLSDKLADKLARVGLIPNRGPAPDARLAAFIDQYIAKRHVDAKPQTLKSFRKFANRLIDFFGPDKSMADVKQSQVDDWVRFMKTKPAEKKRYRGPPYAPATIARMIKGARQLFKAALRADLIARNPFEDTKAGSHTDKDRQFFVTREMTERVLEACPGNQWELLVALSRYGGLRCPSEHFALTWEDVDWTRGRFWVPSPKTQHHEGKEGRWVPLFPELMKYLRPAWELAEAKAKETGGVVKGPVIIINRGPGALPNLRTRFLKIIRRAGLTPWPKLFQNLRASRETELAGEYPLHVACAWIGNSTSIAQKHYLQVTEEDFERAAKSAVNGAAEGPEMSSASAVAGLGNISQISTEAEDGCKVVQNPANSRKSNEGRGMGLEGLEPSTKGL